MVYAVGCDGVFYWATNNSWGKYFTDPDEPGIPPKEKARRQMMRMRKEKRG